VGAVVLEDVAVGLDADASIENSGLDLREVLREAFVLMSDLEGELTGMANDKDSDLVLAGRIGAGVELVESGKNENGGLAHTTLRLTHNIHAQHCLRNAFMLNLGGMLETAVDHGAKALGLQDEILET